MGLELIKPVHDILDRVVEVSHKEIEFIEKNDMPTFAAIKMARKNMPAHLIFHKRDLLLRAIMLPALAGQKSATLFNISRICRVILSLNII